MRQCGYYKTYDLNGQETLAGGKTFYRNYTLLK